MRDTLQSCKIRMDSMFEESKEIHSTVWTQKQKELEEAKEAIQEKQSQKKGQNSMEAAAAAEAEFDAME